MMHLTDGRTHFVTRAALELTNAVQSGFTLSVPPVLDDVKPFIQNLY